jgi:menaquinone-9 beta-reductase
MAYDLIIVGGGLAGSSLAIVMAQAGASVLLLEREIHFRERIRGEGVHLWGVAEAKALGLHDPLLERCGNLLEQIVVHREEAESTVLNLVELTPARNVSITYYHPEMQDVLISLARDAGAEVWRGTQIVQVIPGDTPSIIIQHDNVLHTLSARLLVGADGRNSKMRRWGVFEVNHEPEHLFIAGVLMTGIPTEPSTGHMFLPEEAGCGVQFFYLSKERFRCYFISGDRASHPKISGRAGLPNLYQYLSQCHVPESWLEKINIVGPLASFEGAPTWVRHAFRHGIVLIGDAAAAPDPCFGGGQSLTFRDIRRLSELLLSNDDWNTAAEQYANAHDRDFQSVLTLERWLAQARYTVGPATRHIREHAAAAQARGEAPNLLAFGPDQPTDEDARRRFLGY